MHPATDRRPRPFCNRIPYPPRERWGNLPAIVELLVLRLLTGNLLVPNGFGIERPYTQLGSCHGPAGGAPAGGGSAEGRRLSASRGIHPPPPTWRGGAR
jgi:hypothetical protein